MLPVESSQGEVEPNHEKVETKPVRSAFYIDAFNLYYGIVDLEQPHLKWINLWDLCHSLIPKKQETLTKVAFFSAYNKHDSGKFRRHELYVKVLEHFGVTCEMGHFIRQPRSCDDCGHNWEEASEKQSDVNLALHLFHDAATDAFDHAYLLTADSDQAATAKMLKAKYPAKKLTSVTPPTKQASNHILTYADAHITLKDTHLERAVMAALIMGNDEKGRPALIAQRPKDYEPPQGWVHPRDRPKK